MAAEAGNSQPPQAPTSEMDDVDKDLLCPICMQIIKDAFMTACGHNFCYMCIATHLRNKSTCPCCAQFLAPGHLFPNFLLNKLLMKASVRQKSKISSPLEQFRQMIEKGCDASVQELESLLYLITQKKSKMEQEETKTNSQILLDFLHCLRKKKIDELNEIQSDLQLIKEDVQAVERRRSELHRIRESHMSKCRMPVEESTSRSITPILLDQHNATASRVLNAIGQFNLSSRGSSSVIPSNLRKDPHDMACIENLSHSGLALARKRQIYMQFHELQDCYFQKRRYSARASLDQHDVDTQGYEGYTEGLEDFQSVLSAFTKYSRLRVIAELRFGELFHSDAVSSIEFDRDDELFATAGISRRIKIFEFASVVNEPANGQYPAEYISTRSKLSCLSWNKYIRNHLASSDYEGIITVWDVSTQQSIMEYEEHEKRAWSVDFSCKEPSMLVSGSDDCKVKVWCTKQEASAINIDVNANVCSVKYNPGSSFHLAVGSADNNIHYYDLRNTREPLNIFTGHRKAVSYVKFVSYYELASASTDNTLRLWDVKENTLVRVFRGHTNEKNFVGLTVNSQYISCGSETNEVFVYHKELSIPAVRHKFVNSDINENDNDANSYFISAMCWKNESPTMLAANSQGTIKVLTLAS